MTTDRDRSLLLLLTGLFAVWLSWSGVLLDFVRPSMRPYVLVSGLVAVALALLAPGGLLSRGGAPAVHDHDHGGLSISWLLVLPMLVVILVPPSPLGANAVRSRLVTARSGPGSFPPVAPPDRGAVPMSMAEYATRALRDSDRSLDGVRVRLVGFVSGTGEGGGYRLGRFVIFCCAADAEAVEVVVTGDGERRTTDEWLAVEGYWVPGDPPALRAESVRRVGKPAKPYEYTDVWSG